MNMTHHYNIVFSLPVRCKRFDIILATSYLKEYLKDLEKTLHDKGIRDYSIIIIDI